MPMCYKIDILQALKDKDDIEVFIKDLELHTGMKIRMRERSR